MAERERDTGHPVAEEKGKYRQTLEDRTVAVEGDIIQITNEDHQWFPALLVISKVADWGVQAYTTMVNNSDEPNGLAYIKLIDVEYEWVGVAKIVVPD